MVTRREVLGGLGATVFCGTGYSAPVRSTIGGFHNSFVDNVEEEPLPDGVTAVEYIQQEGNRQYIATGIVPPVGTIMRCRFQFTQTANSQFCCMGYSNPRRFGFGIESNVFKVCTATWYGVLNFKDTAWHNWLIDEPRKVASIDGVSKTINPHGEFIAGEISASLGFTLFGRNEGYMSNYCNQARVASLYLGTASERLFDGIACRYEGAGYLYDRVSGQLFGNVGTGNFIIGPDI